MRYLLTTTALVALLSGSAFASVGGSDGFGGDETSTGSSFGNGSGSFGTSTQTGNEGYDPNTNVDRLAGYDRPNGNVDLYNENPYHRTKEFLGTSDDGYGLGDYDMTSGIGGRTVEQMLADKQAREAPKPAPKPMPTLYNPPAPGQTDMGSVGTAVINIQQTPPPSLGIIPDPVDVAVEAIGELVVTPDAPITPAEKNVARGLNLFTGIAAGIGAKGNNRLAHMAGKPKGTFNRREGAIIGGTAAEAKSEVMGNKRFEDFVQSFTRYTGDDLADRQRELARQIKDPERRERFIEATDTVREAKETRDRERKMSGAADRKDKGDGNGTGGKGGKNGKGKSN